MSKNRKNIYQNCENIGKEILQNQYNQWRTAYEKQLQEQEKKCFKECCFADARISFSEFIELDEIISFDDMWELENNYFS